jgi:molecular chaperone GrpE
MSETVETESTSEPAIKVNDRRRFYDTGESRMAESDESPVNSEQPGTEVDERLLLTQELAAARKRIDDLARAVLAGERDREEFKQRVTRERERMLDVERGTVAQVLLETVDELDLCLHNVRQNEMTKGLRLVRENLMKKLEAMGIVRVELVGRPFDPNLAEATDMEMSVNESDDGLVVLEMSGCYELKGKVIRAGRVKVAKFMKPADT